MIGVLDFGAGNLASVGNALNHLGADWRMLKRASDFDRAAALIFPGVGSAGTAMAGLRERGLDGAIRDLVCSGRPYLGICLGMQVLFDSSAEDDSTCLELISGRVLRIPGTRKLPHVGWNTVEQARPNSLFDGIEHPAFYFTHSYMVECQDPQLVCGWTTYGSVWASVVSRHPIYGVQFHPERSGPAGLKLLVNFLHLASGGGLSNAL